MIKVIKINYILFTIYFYITNLVISKSSINISIKTLILSYK